MKLLSAITTLSLALSATAVAQIAQARTESHAGRVDNAIRALSGNNSTEAQSLLCALYGSIEDRDRAIQACEAAATASPNSSDAMLALARAYGDKADHSGTLTGMRMVGKIRSSFERAVQLDPRNVEALSDLGQFYVEAPAMVGGGTDKANGLVGKLAPLSVSRSHRLAAMIAAKNHDDAKAEAEYKAAIAAAHSPEAYVDLAKYYRGRKQFEAAETAARNALQADKEHGPDTLDAAEILLDMHRNVPAAQAALRSYLATPQQGIAQFAHAHMLLGDSLKATGDNNGAQKEYAAALSLAQNYAPARKAAGR